MSTYQVSQESIRLRLALDVDHGDWVPGSLGLFLGRISGDVGRNLLVEGVVVNYQQCRAGSLHGRSADILDLLVSWTEAPPEIAPAPLAHFESILGLECSVMGL